MKPAPFLGLLLGLGCTPVVGPQPGSLREARVTCENLAWARCAGVSDCERHNRKQCMSTLGWSRTRSGWVRVRTDLDIAREVDSIAPED